MGPQAYPEVLLAAMARPGRTTTETAALGPVRSRFGGRDESSRRLGCGQRPALHRALNNAILRRYGFSCHPILRLGNAAGFHRRMRKTARPVVWEGGGERSPSLDPIRVGPPT